MRFGLYIIGDEILSGRRKDKHLTAVTSKLREQGCKLDWAMVLGDSQQQLVKQFTASVANGDVVFSVGGIGGTPDDLTRPSIAEVLAVPCEPHPDALPILQHKYQDQLSAERLRMIEFPQGAELIPNPINQIPGFSIANHHFLPGFPQMAHPMIDWLLANRIQFNEDDKLVEQAIKVQIAESKLIPLMDEVNNSFSGVSVFSLPVMRDNGWYVEFGVRATSTVATAAMEYIKNYLTKESIEWRDL